MKYAILLKDRRKVDTPQLVEYCAASGFAIDEIVVFEEFATFCQRLKAGRPCGAPSHKQKYLDSQKEKIKDLLKGDIGVLQISELLNCSYKTQYRYMKKHPEMQNG